MTRITASKLSKVLTILSALVWLVNGLFCKILNLVPRHEEIVARILGAAHANLLTKAIGISEILMAGWVLSNFKSRLNSLVQILVVITMNCIEFFIAPDLLLWGKLNIVFALGYVTIIYMNEFWLKQLTVKK